MTGLQNTGEQDPAVDSIDADLKLIRKAVREAGLLALDYYSERRKNGAWLKEDGTSVSDADIAVDRLLRERLQGARPDYGWLSEETIDDLGRLEKQRVFIVDPIDGTRAFLKNKPHWVISVALVVAGATEIGCLYNPVADEFFEAVRGQGARLNGNPVKVGDRNEIEGSTIIASPDSFRSKKWPQKWPVVSTFTVNSIAYRVALVAANRADAMLTLSGTNDWDLAAAVLILREAGGVITDHKGNPFAFNTGNTRHMSVLAAGPHLHEKMLQRTRLVEPGKRLGSEPE